VTALVPIVIPHRPDEPRGHLVMFPDLRPVRRFVNVLKKPVMESAHARRLWCSGWTQRARRGDRAARAGQRLFLLGNALAACKRGTPADERAQHRAPAFQRHA
jgi:hypothetical protein